MLTYAILSLKLRLEPAVLGLAGFAWVSLEDIEQTRRLHFGTDGLLVGVAGERYAMTRERTGSFEDVDGI